MAKRKAIKIASGCCLLALLIPAVLYTCRGNALRYMADRRIARLEERYGLNITYADLTMKGLNSIYLQELTVVPVNRDTLLALQSLDVRIGLWQLIRGNINVKKVSMNGLNLSFIKQDSVANYDFLFSPPGNDSSTANTKKEQVTDYAHRTNTLLNLLFGLLPGNGELTGLCISERKDRNFVTFQDSETKHLQPPFSIGDIHFGRFNRTALEYKRGNKSYSAQTLYAYPRSTLEGSLYPPAFGCRNRV